MTTVALALAVLCPLNVFGFPSVSPFWTASNLASFNNLRFDYPLGSRSAEWLILGPVLDADMVNALLRRDALRSVTAVQALCEFSPSNLDPKRNVPVQTSTMCSPLARTWHGQNAVWVGFASAKRIFLAPVMGFVACGKATCPPSSASAGGGTNFAFARGHSVLDVRDECSQQKCARHADTQCISGEHLRA